MDLKDSLQKNHLFSFMKASDLEEIVSKSGGVIECEEGKQLFFEGDLAMYFYIVLSGRIRISRTSDKGKELVLKDIQPGESFAEVILFEKNTYPATATAHEDSELLKIEKESFIKLLENKNLAIPFIVNLIKKIRYLARKIELYDNAEVPDRFYHFIETYYGKKESISLKESKKEIAGIIGTIPETFSRMINKLKKSGHIISWDKSQLVLKKGFWKDY